jgi:hypothetical protein
MVFYHSTTPAFRDMVLAIRAAVGSRALVVPAPGWAIPPLSPVLGAALHHVVLTREEYGATNSAAAYANELTRHYR